MATPATIDMKYEVEQKFRLADAAQLESRLVAQGVRLGAAIEQVDRYFAHPVRDFAATDEALRIRTVGEQNWVTYKGPKIDAATKTRRELEFPLCDGKAGAAQFAELLAALGFSPVATVSKRRRTAALSSQGQAVELALDDVAQVGRFCELELAADEHDLDAARAALAALARDLGLADVERRSYLELLLAR